MFPFYRGTGCHRDCNLQGFHCQVVQREQPLWRDSCISCFIHSRTHPACGGCIWCFSGNGDSWLIGDWASGPVSFNETWWAATYCDFVSSEFVCFYIFSLAKAAFRQAWLQWPCLWHQAERPARYPDTERLSSSFRSLPGATCFQIWESWLWLRGTGVE